MADLNKAQRIALGVSVTALVVSLFFVPWSRVAKAGLTELFGPDFPFCTFANRQEDGPPR